MKPSLLILILFSFCADLSFAQSRSRSRAQGNDSENYLRIYRLNSPVSVPPSWSNEMITYHLAVCESPIDLNNPPSGVNCLVVGLHRNITKTQVTLFNTISGAHPTQYPVQFTYEQGSSYKGIDMINMMRFATSSQPFLFVMSLRSGLAYYGYYLADLKRIN